MSHITTPYLIIDYGLTEDIKNAAMRSGCPYRGSFHSDKKRIQIVAVGLPGSDGSGVKILSTRQGLSTARMVADDGAVVRTVL